MKGVKFTFDAVYNNLCRHENLQNGDLTIQNIYQFGLGKTSQHLLTRREGVLALVPGETPVILPRVD